ILAVTIDRKMRLAAAIPDQVAEHVIELGACQWLGVAELNRPSLPGGNEEIRKHQVVSRGHMDFPLIPRSVMQPKIWMKSNGHRHGRRREVLDPRLHF